MAPTIFLFVVDTCQDEENLQALKVTCYGGLCASGILQKNLSINFMCTIFQIFLQDSHCNSVLFYDEFCVLDP